MKHNLHYIMGIFTYITYRKSQSLFMYKVENINIHIVHLQIFTINREIFSPFSVSCNNAYKFNTQCRLHAAAGNSQFVICRSAQLIHKPSVMTSCGDLMSNLLTLSHEIGLRRRVHHYSWITWWLPACKCGLHAAEGKQNR